MRTRNNPHYFLELLKGGFYFLCMQAVSGYKLGDHPQPYPQEDRVVSCDGQNYLFEIATEVSVVANFCVDQSPYADLLRKPEEDLLAMIQAGYLGGNSSIPEALNADAVTWQRIYTVGPSIWWNNGANRTNVYVPFSREGITVNADFVANVSSVLARQTASWEARYASCEREGADRMIARASGFVLFFIMVSASYVACSVVSSARKKPERLNLLAKGQTRSDAPALLKGATTPASSSVPSQEGPQNYGGTLQP